MEENVKTTISKNQTAEIPTKNGSKYSYKYVDIAQIHDYLESVGARYYQYIDRIDNDDYIMTVPIINNIAEPPRRGCRVVDATLMGVNNPAQQQGSALTYARRYSLLMAFGLATEDDDAASLSQKQEVEVTEKDAEEYVFNFGKHKGKKLIDLVEDEDGYIDWLLNNSKDEYLLKCIEILTGQVPLTEDDQEEILDLLNKMSELEIATNTSHDDILDHYGVKSNKQMTLEQLRDCIATLKRKQNRGNYE